MEVRERRYRASSSSTTAEMNRSEEKSSSKARLIKPNLATTLKKLQVIYYLSKNGHLEHPHFIEVTHLAHHPLRLSDVLERLTILRGKGMPSLYSWSCKRSYKNGYVWNDLAENDVIYPSESEGPEYVLKGSQLIEACTGDLSNSNPIIFIEKVEQIQVGNKIGSQDPLVFRPKRKILAAKRHPEPEEVYNNQYEDDHEEEEEEEEYEEKISYNNTLPVETCSSTSNSRCSRGVSTDEIPETTPSPKNPSPQLVVIDNTSPPSTASSTISENANNNSKRFEDGDPTDPFPGRGSVLRQLIACGGGGMVRPAPVPPFTAARKSSSLHKGVLRKTAAKAEEDEEMMIKFMSENPRFGNVQSEEKEYFSGSIVEGIREERVKVENGPCGLQKSSSYNEERSTKAGLGEVKEEEEVKREKGAKGRCLPIKKSSSKQSKK